MFKNLAVTLSTVLLASTLVGGAAATTQTPQPQPTINHTTAWEAASVSSRVGLGA